MEVKRIGDDDLATESIRKLNALLDRMKEWGAGVAHVRKKQDA